MLFTIFVLKIQLQYNYYMIPENQLTEKQLVRKKTILQTTEEIVYQHGFYKMSLDDLVGDLKISKSTIYDFFGSKEGLIEAVVDRFGERLEQGLEDIMNDSTLTVADKLFSIAHTQGTATACLKSKFMSDLRIHAPLLYEKFQEGKLRRTQRYYAPIIEAGMTEGLFDPSLDKTFILRMYLEMSALACSSGIFDHVSMTRTEAYMAIIKVFLHGTTKK